jgi:hypothetical protein
MPFERREVQVDITLATFGVLDWQCGKIGDII